MTIVKYGTVTFREGRGPLIEGWLVERTPEDPEDATMEQLLLAYAIHWAKAKFDEAYKSAAMQVLVKWSQMKAAAEAGKKPS